MKTIKIVGLSMCTMVLLTAFASATSSYQETKTQTPNTVSDPFIDPSFYLTKRYLPLLQKTLPSLEESDYKIVVRELIKKIETKGSANSTDVKEIALNNRLHLYAIYFLRFISTTSSDGSNTWNEGYCNHGFRLMYYGGILHWVAWHGAFHGLFGVNVSIGPYTLPFDHAGWAIGYFGFGDSTWGFDMQNGFSQKFELNGIGSLIFVRT